LILRWWVLVHFGSQKKKKKQKRLAFNWVELRKPSIFVINWVSSCLSFPFSWVPSLLLLHLFAHHSGICTTTVISLQSCGHWMLSFSISYWDLIKFPYSATDTTNIGVWRGERRLIERVTFWITLLHEPQTIESPNSTHSETHIGTTSACTKGWLAMLTNHCDSH
jgi:hypothetical protein